MATIAGHTYVLGRCSCGVWRSDINSLVKNAKENGITLVGQMNVAHVGALNSMEEREILSDIQEEAIRIEMAMEQVGYRG